MPPKRQDGGRGHPLTLGRDASRGVEATRVLRNRSWADDRGWRSTSTVEYRCLMLIRILTDSSDQFEAPAP